MIKKIAYFAVLTSFIGASVLFINLGFMELSLFRLTIIILTLLIIFKSINSKESAKILNDNNSRLSTLIMLVWFAYAVISVIWVKDYTLWVREVYFLALGVICIILFCNVYKNSNDIILCFKIIAVLIIIHNFIGWYEVLSGHYLFLENSVSYYMKNRFPVSVFRNTNDFATFLMMAVFFLYICIMNSKYFIEKTAYFITLLSSLGLLFFTNSRANIIGLVLAMAVYVILQLKNKKTQIMLLLISIAFCIFIILNIDFIINAFNSLFAKMNLISSNNSISIRINLIKNGMYFLTKTFWFGTGAGNAQYWIANYSIFDTSGIMSMHNWWMEILTNYGIVIFFLYIIFYITLFKSLHRKYKLSQCKADKTISLALMCCMAGYVVGSVSASSNIDTEWLWVFWGIAVSYQGIGEKNLRPKKHRVPSTHNGM